jgi:hypothetical protein
MQLVGSLDGYWVAKFSKNETNSSPISHTRLPVQEDPGQVACGEGLQAL